MADGITTPTTRSSPKTAPRRERLSRDRVLAAAMAIADDRGLDALTMRGLARTLGIEAMSLYHYAASRDEIVDAIVTLVVEQFELPDPTLDWKAAIRASEISAHRVLRRHPWACHPLMSARGVRPPRLRHIDALLGRLTEAGLAPGLADLTYHALDSHLLGSTLWEAGYASGLSHLSPTDQQDFVRQLHLDAYPNLLAHVAFHDAPRATGSPGEFEFGLDLILDGAERLRDAAWTAAGDTSTGAP